MKLTRLKAVISGQVVEIFEYEKPLSYEFRNPENRNNDHDPHEKTEEEKSEVRKRSMQRAKTWLTRLINSNAWGWEQSTGEAFPPVFITFTFAENLTDVALANKIFTLFIKRLNFNLYKRKKSVLKYVAVTEFQKRGAVHFHCLFFNFPVRLIETERHTRRIANIWGHGFVDTKDVNDVGKATAYLTKYMLKSFDDARLDGKKRYFGSRNLKRPKVVMLEHLVTKLLTVLPPEKKAYENTYVSEYQGTTKYTRYHLDAGQQINLKNSEIKSTIPTNNPII